MEKEHHCRRKIKRRDLLMLRLWSGGGSHFNLISGVPWMNEDGEYDDGVRLTSREFLSLSSKYPSFKRLLKETQEPSWLLDQRFLARLVVQAWNEMRKMQREGFDGMEYDYSLDTLDFLSHYDYLAHNSLKMKLGRTKRKVLARDTDGWGYWWDHKKHGLFDRKRHQVWRYLRNEMRNITLKEMENARAQDQEEDEFTSLDQK